MHSSDSLYDADRNVHTTQAGRLSIIVVNERHHRQSRLSSSNVIVLTRLSAGIPGVEIWGRSVLLKIVLVSEFLQNLSTRRPECRIILSG